MSIIIVSDAHVNETTGNHRPFFDMLRACEACDHDLIFMGDIFDLWIALPRYEKEIHHRFLAWCKRQKERRTIGYIEGNHEYFLADERKQFFSWCTSDAFRQDENGNVFCHGDQVNSYDKNYLRFRRIAKSGLCKQILRFLLPGPRLVEYLKEGMKQTNLNFRQHLPKQEIETFAEQRFAAGGRTIFVGHFHQPYFYRGLKGGELYTVSGWLGSGMVTLFDEAQRRAIHKNWREILA